MNRNILKIAVLLVILLTGCSVFIKDEESYVLKLKYQNRDFILLSDLIRNNETIPKDSSVRLVVTTGEKWVKIYAYKSDEELLKSNRFLLLYMFEKDFPEERFSSDYIDKELSRLVRIKGASEPVKKVFKQKSRGKIKK